MLATDIYIKKIFSIYTSIVLSTKLCSVLRQRFEWRERESTSTYLRSLYLYEKDNKII